MDSSELEKAENVVADAVVVVAMLLDQLERGRGRRFGAECLVTDFGAQCDNATNDTLALQKALDSCSAVALPDGRTCLTHALHLRNASQLRIPGNAVLKAMPNASARARTSASIRYT